MLYFYTYSTQSLSFLLYKRDSYNYYPSTFSKKGYGCKLLIYCIIQK